MGISQKHLASPPAPVMAEEEERLVTVVDFDMLCSTVAMQTNHGKWAKFEEDYEENDGEFEGGVFRMWEGEILDCFDDKCLVTESSFCPWYRFGKNMKRAGFGSCILQGFVYIIISVIALCNVVAFAITKKHCFLYLGVPLVLCLAMYLGFQRSKMRNKFKIKGSDSCLDDCVSHLICPCCTLAQESRTLEMNNVQDGMWHGRGDMICVGSYIERHKTSLELSPPPIVSIESQRPCLTTTMQIENPNEKS